MLIRDDLELRVAKLGGLKWLGLGGLKVQLQLKHLSWLVSVKQIFIKHLY